MRQRVEAAPLDPSPPPDPTFLKRVLIQNYKSIASCDVRLGSLTFLVGPNGSGKSNFMDALRFVTDATRHSLDFAVRERGGINEVRRRSGRRPTHFSIRLEVGLPNGQEGYYQFLIGAKARGGYEVQREECSLTSPELGQSQFTVMKGRATTTSRVTPPAQSDRLYLAIASSFPEYRSLYEALSNMGFYNLSPDRIRDLQAPDTGELLLRDGSNLASVLGRISETNRPMKERIEEYLAAILPSLRGVDTRAVGPKETIEFRQSVAGVKSVRRFYAANMSDGTLRALGILVALFQSRDGGHSRIPLVGIEEPEAALHPAASGVLLDGLRDASTTTQIVVTSHSPDLLNNDDIETESILAVANQDGLTRIGPIRATSRSALREHLYTAGELLSLGQLQLDLNADESAGEAIMRTPNGSRR